MIKELFYGAYNTLLLAGLSWLIGLPLGVFCSYMSQSSSQYAKVLSILSIGFVITPFIAILFWIHYPLQNLLNVVWPPFFTSTSLLSVYIAIQSGEILSQEMHLIKTDYTDVADVLGIDKRYFIKKIMFPSAALNSLPRMLNLAIASIHITMFASLIGVEELFRVSLRLNAEYLQPVKIFSIMALFYCAICFPLYIVAFRIKKKLKRV